MYCQKCGAENGDKAKHCKECGAKLFNTQVPQEEKNSFIKTHKLVLCIAGILVIFVIFALMSMGNNQTDVDSHLSYGIEKALENNGYEVSRSVKDGNVQLNALYLNLTDKNTDEDMIAVMIFPLDMLNEVASEYDLSPREINGIEGYGGYSDKVYTYAFVDNGNTVVIMPPSKNSTILEAIVKDY
jgi:hypothetical protein